MSGFSADWLALREAADHRARSAGLVRALTHHLGNRTEISVVDLGSGTGSNLRGLAGSLPQTQHWTLVDHDAALLDAARKQLAAWADSVQTSEDGVILGHVGRRVTVSFRTADLARDLDGALGVSPDLITASALFDLVSPEFIEGFSDAAASRRAIFYTVLTYNGTQRWLPRMAADDDIISAFNRHQTTDKGFGVSAGPAAPRLLAERFRRLGYAVEEGDSPWQLGPADAALIDQLARGMAGAVTELATVDTKTIADWLRSARTGVQIGHTDTLAVPV